MMCKVKLDENNINMLRKNKDFIKYYFNICGGFLLWLSVCLFTMFVCHILVIVGCFKI
jgi:hypothetical protein